MTIRLRGHHLLCLLGYRGMGYSDDFCVNMTIIYETLRDKPETVIEIVEGPDDICKAYPADKPPHCEGSRVFERDAVVLEKLGIPFGLMLSWFDIYQKVAGKVVPEDIRLICGTCPWEPYGVCREGVRMIGQGEKLPPIRK